MFLTAKHMSRRTALRGLGVTVGEAPDGSPRLADVCRLHQFFASITKLVCVATATSADTNPASRNALVRRVGPA